MTSLWKRLLSLTMVLCMVLCAVSMTAAAHEPDGLIPETAQRGSMGEFAWRNPAYPEQGASGTAQNALAGEMINRELYYSDFTTREYVVKELHQAMIERKNEIYLYYKTDKELTEADMNLLMEDALMLETESVWGGDYLALHVIDFMAVWEPIIEGGTYYNVVGFGVVYSTTSEQEGLLTEKIYKLRSEICDGKVNDYQLVKSIYDYIMTNVEYDLDNLENLDYLIQHTGYAALLHGKASAIGYSLLFYRMANEYGLDAEMVAGTIDGNLFIWNAVKLYDKWYQINLGMDALTGSDECFLFGLDDMSAGHKLPDEYLTPEFQAEYPFAKTRFIPEQAGSGKAGDNVTWSYDAATATLTFSGSGKMADQKTEWGASPWFNYIDGGANVVIGEGITYIGASSFWNRNLLSLQLPASLEVIGSGAFSTSAGLKELTLPKNVKKIEQYAFYDSELESIKLPEGLDSIGTLAFANCDKLTAVTLPDSLTTIGNNAFSDSGLTEIFIPRNVTSIGVGAFAMNSIFVGDDLEKAPKVTKYEVHPENTIYSAKDGLLLSKDGTKLVAVPCDRTGTFVVPEGITEIADGAFRYCMRIQEIILPDGLTKIGEKAFGYNRALSYVKIPDSVTEIGAYAFENCITLLSVQLPTGLTEISEGLFKASNLRTVQIPDSVTMIGKDAFKESYVYSVALPISLKTVEAGAFGGLYGKFDEQFSHVYYAGTQEQWNAVSVAENNDALKNAELHLGERALSGGGWKYDISEGRLEITSAGINTYPWLGWRDEIKSVYWNESPNYMNEITIKIGAGMFKNCSNLKVFAFRDDVKYNGIMGRIAGEAFYGCTSLETFTVPGSVYWIYDRAFGDCTSLKTVYLSRDLRGVAQEAFAGCTALTDVYVDKTEAEWAENTVPGGGEKVNPFVGMPNVTVHFAEAVTGGDLGNNLEWSYDKDSRTLTISGQGPMRDFAEGEERPWDEWVNEGGTFNLVIEEGVTSIGARAFKQYDGQIFAVTYIIQFASTVKEIREEAFLGNTFERLAFNKGLETIGRRAFANGRIEWDVNSDDVLILPDTLVTVGNSAFYNTNCDILYLPASLKTIGEFAFSTNTGTKIYYGGSEAQWKQMQIGDRNYALLPEYGDYKQPVYNSGCPHAVYLLRAVEATCTETGLTAGKYCGGCGEVFEAQQVVPKTPHNFVNCECTKCGMTIDPSWPLDGACGEHLTWSYDLNSGKLTVSGEGAMQNYTSAKDVPWSVWGEYITSVTVATTVTAIGDNAFASCNALKEVNYDSTKWNWQQIDIGSGNEALTKAKLITTEVFTDVKTTDWFYGSVNWAVASNVTGGLGNGLFGPNNSCTRAQVVTFLYAAAGKPEVTTTDNPFVDVADNAWYLKPVLWAVENGITSGVDATHFGPDATCTRAQVVTFLYAAAGKPEIKAEASEFNDVKDSDWFVKPVMWAKENDVTGGVSEGMFGPNQTCTRAQVVTFLYKVYG